MPISVHAQGGKKHQMNERADSVQRAIGKMQFSCIIPERQQNPWQQDQGGVVGHSSDLGQWRTCTRLGGVSVVSKVKLSIACMLRD